MKKYSRWKRYGFGKWCATKPVKLYIPRGYIGKVLEWVAIKTHKCYDKGKIGICDLIYAVEKEKEDKDASN